MALHFAALRSKPCISKPCSSKPRNSSLAVSEFYRPDRPTDSADSAGHFDYTRKNDHPAYKRQGRNLRSAPALHRFSPAGPAGIASHNSKPEPRSASGLDAGQVSDSTNTSSRFLRSDGNSASTSRNAAVAISTAESGRVKNTVQSPREINSARRRFSSISGPSTIPSSSGAGSKSCLISQ